MMPPTAVDLSASSVDENSAGAIIGTLSTTDVDTNDHPQLHG